MRRLLAFLPMLFLAATLAAQVNCQITNLNVVWAPGPAPCQYFAVLSFEHTGTTNQFKVQGNGQNYGTFPYNTVPVSIGPFTAGAQPIPLEFVVSDAEIQGCESFILAELPACNSGGADCAITNVQVQTGDCLPNAPAFELWLNFEVQNPTNDFFELWASGGQYLGIFPLSQLPLQLPAFPWGNGPVQELKICINENADCCTVVEFPTPPCVNPVPPCSISDLVATVGDCTTDSTFSVTIDFNVFDSTQVDSFRVSANGQSLGTFGFNQLPLTLDSIDWNGLLFTYMTVCTGNLPGCCREIQVAAPDCLPFEPCEVTDIFTNPISCTSDSTYKLRVNFQATSPGLDSFAVYANGALLGIFPNSAAPLTIDSFPWSGNNFDVIKICVQHDATTAPCCRTEEFQAPDCLNGGPCEVYDLVVDPGGCTSDSTYSLWVNFQVQNPPSSQFQLWANGQVYGTYNLSQLPLNIPNFPWNGGQNDVVKVCFSNNIGTPGCCGTLEFPVPDCLNPGGDCEIFNLQVETGDCNVNDSTYLLVVNFQVQNPPSQIFVLYANGVAFGTYNLSQLPLTIPNFPWNGGPNDVVKVCMADQGAVSGCCRILEFPVPDCFNQGGNCEIFDLQVDVSGCTSDSTYSLTVNFEVQNPPSNTFQLWANGQLFGTYNLSQLALNIPNFPWNGGANDVIKVCMGTPNAPQTCCKTLEFPVPDCLNPGGDCEIFNLQVETGDCNVNDSTYLLVVNFQVQNPPSQIFVLYANGVAFGTYNLSQLPLTIPNFPWNGGPNDVVKVCMADQGAVSGCCRILEFPVPDCFNPGGPCEIFDLQVDVSGCTSDSTYSLTVNFEVQNPPSNTFQLWANGQLFGTYNLSQLALNIPNFPWNGGANDVIKVCMGTPNAPQTCCKTLEFPVPDCLNPGGDCEIFDLQVETGDCHPDDSSYVLVVNFQVQNPPSSQFQLWANGQLFGTYNLGQLPLTIPNFPWNGGANDVVKVCMFGQNSMINCCRTLEFAVPDCFDPGGPCEIFDLVVDTGDCTSDSTYSIWINFQVQNPPSGQFALWANGVLFGTFSLNQLPLNIPNFPWNGGPNDYLKVCSVTPGTPSACCRTIEFPVPDCLGGPNDDCHIFDLQVIRTPCLCGQFFAVLTFEHENGGPAGFDIVGNGNNYGNYGYNHPQPIIIGPLDGNGVTEYEFAVVDHLNDDCRDAVELGKVECTTPTDEVVGQGGQMVLSPNPASNQLNVNATLPGLSNLGEATVEVYHADGRRVRSFNVPEGGNFRMDVFDLPAGIYRLSVQTAAGRVEGSFARQ